MRVVSVCYRAPGSMQTKFQSNSHTTKGALEEWPPCPNARGKSSDFGVREDGVCFLDRLDSKAEGREAEKEEQKRKTNWPLASYKGNEEEAIRPWPRAWR